jgi:hypothetical protein
MHSELEKSRRRTMEGNDCLFCPKELSEPRNLMNIDLDTPSMTW